MSLSTSSGYLDFSSVCRRRWLSLAVVVAAQFMFVVDAFIVNVAIPSIRTNLVMSEAGIEAVIVVYQIAFATLVITGGRLGDLRGRKRTFVMGLLGFTAASVWCGLAGSGAELIAARLAQGASGALMSPQVLATIHTLFPDEARARAFATYSSSMVPLDWPSRSRHGGCCPPCRVIRISAWTCPAPRCCSSDFWA
jgi:MFS family permease